MAENDPASPADDETEAPEIEAPEAPAEDKPAEDDAQTDEAEAKPAEDPAALAKKRTKERFDALLEQRTKAQQEAAYWRGRAEAAAGQPTQATQSSGPAAKPIPQAYPDTATYVEALTEWKTEQKFAEHQVAQAQAQQIDRWSTRLAEARKVLPDIDEVITSSPLELRAHVHDTLLRSEAGPYLAHHLAKNPEVLHRLNALPPADAAHELGLLEARITPARQAAGKHVSDAPPPINPIRGGNSRATPNLEQASTEEYDALRRKQGAWWARKPT